jgi:putative hydrolases of HD superfamily
MINHRHSPSAASRIDTMIKSHWSCLAFLFSIIITTSASLLSTTTMNELTFVSEICGVLKRLKRTGWVRHHIPLPESDADHMHRCAMCALLLINPADPRDDYTTHSNVRFHPSRVDTARLLRMAVTHDVCEALAGDITPLCHSDLVQSKHAKEEAAMEEIRKVVGDPLGKDLFDLWKEYESQETTEAIYCKDIDKFEMVVQAFEYEKEHLRHCSDVTTDPSVVSSNEKSSMSVTDEPLRGFYITTNSVMKTPLFRRLDKELREKREVFLKEKGWEVTDLERQQY